jgi:outer membrane protein assembly factor BamB
MKKSSFRRAEPTTRLLILAVTVSIVLALVTVSCGHGRAGNSANSQLTTRNSQLSLDAILAEIDAYQPPKGVDAARFAMLKAELRRQVVAQRTGKTTSAAPTGSWDELTDLDIITNTGGTQATLAWTEKLWGDYSNNGSVDIGDIVPMVLYYGERTDEGSDDGHKLVQGDTDPEITIGDIIPIARNYGAHLVGYRIYRGQQVGSYILWETTWRPNLNTNNPDWSIDRPDPPPVSTRPSYTYVDDISGLLNKTNVRYKVIPYGDDEEGLVTGPAIMPPPGTFYISGTISWWGSGVPNVIIQATGGHSGTSGSAGLYKVFGLTNGSYTLTPNKPNWSFTPSTFQVSVSGGNVTNVNFDATPGLADTAWPKFRGNARNTGLSSHAGPQTNAVNWTYDTGSAITSSPAIGLDGTILVGSSGGVFWRFQPDGSPIWGLVASDSPFDSSPAVGADGSVYVASYDGVVRSFSTQGTGQGWRTTPGGFIASSPAIGLNGSIYIGSQDGNVYALNPGDGSTTWTRATGAEVNSSVAVGADGTIYVGSHDGYTYALYPTNGSVKWAAATGQVNESPAIGSDGTIYVGTPGGYVYALNPGDGSVKWRYAVYNWVTASPAIGPDGTVYVVVTGSLIVNNYVYALRSNGSLKWPTAMPNALMSSPAVGSDGKIYLGCGDNKVYCLNPGDGSVCWSYETGGVVTSSPAIAADGTLYVGSADGKIYAFGS